MKKQTLLLMLVLLVFIGCTKQVSFGIKKNEQSIAVQKDTMNFLTTILPEKLDLNMDIDSLSLFHLRLLRSYPYAKKGLNFSEFDIYYYYKANTVWYEKLIEKLWETEKLPLTYEDVRLSTEEQLFVERVDKRITELRHSNFVDQGEYRLANVDNIVNIKQFTEYEPLFIDKLLRNNFVITQGANLQLFHLYEENSYRQIPSFITTDLFLQTFHIFFSYTLKSLEKQQFIPLIIQLSLELYNECIRIAEMEVQPEIKNLAEYNATFYAIPYHLLTGKQLKIPSRYQDDFLAEIANIDRAKDNFSHFLSMTDNYFLYSLFKPRGHYTRNPEMKAYFKAMMWLQTASFCREETEQLKQVVFSAVLLNTTQTSKKEPVINLYKSVYESIAFLIGLPDNLSIMDVADFLKKENIFQLETALSDETIAKTNKMLLELSKTHNQIKPEILLTCEDKINFMPQRYLIDNEVLLKMVDVKKNSKRAYPKGLDVFAAFGSQPALDLLESFYNEKEQWSDFSVRMSQMQTKFKNYKEWNHSIYNKWIECLLTLQKTNKNMPEFMQTPAWSYKNLNTSLASWAELKHDAILYGEQPTGAECGGGDEPPIPTIKGYVEPNLPFWSKLDEMLKLTRNLLEKNNLLTLDLKNKMEQLSNYTHFLIDASSKELNKKELSDNEYSFIEYIGSSIEYFTLSIIDPDLYLDNWSLVKGPDKSIAVVADIYTRNVPDCSKNGVLHVATGNANNIYVVVEIGGYLYLTRGATFSYYEFVKPLDIRLTDEKWQKMIDEKKMPQLLQWMNSIVIKNEPRLDERVFYSSGC